jgi:hypothetical protein
MALERNSPCPCGSGKKYKKCCMLKPAGTPNQFPFLLSSQQNRDPFPITNNQSTQSNEEQQNQQHTKSSTTHQAEDSTAQNAVSTIKLLDMNNAAEVIEKLGMDDLRTLHNLIANRINTLVKAKRETALSNFNPGNRVRFTTKYGETKTGTVIRVNQKTVSIAVDNDPGYWKVSPQILERI